MKRTRTHDEPTDRAPYRPYKRPRTCPPPTPPPSLAGTRLAYHAGEWPPPSPPSHTVSILRPCAQQCTTWDDAVTAFARLGHGGSVVCKRGDGATRFVGTVPTLRAWWTQQHARTRADRQPVVLEENLWSRHPRSPVACLRYAFGACPNAGALTELRAGAPTSRVIPYAWTTMADSPSLRAIASATRTFTQTHRKALPSAGVLDLCWFVDDRTVYVVDCLPRDSTQPI